MNLPVMAAGTGLRTTLSIDVADELSQPGGPGDIALWWVGQAGFLIRHDALRIGVDLYLSDSLARKYAGTRYPHRRMTMPPVAPEQLTRLNYVFCSHAHTDHMDPDTLRAIADVNASCRFVVPRAERAKALERGIPADRMIAVTTGDRVPLGAGCWVGVVPAAHEQRRQDADGNEVFLGYVFHLGARAIYHPGDCIPFEGQEQWLAPHRIDLALLPVNGRDAERASNGVPGNFHLEEAVQLCCQVGIPQMIGHHFGLFDFNTIDPAEGEARIARLKPACRAGLAQPRVCYWLSQPEA